jgi:hypothetical protein
MNNEAQANGIPIRGVWLVPIRHNNMLKSLLYDIDGDERLHEPSL